MILVDTSIWIDHLRHHEIALELLIDQNRVLLHPFVVGEIALGSMRDHDAILDGLSKLPQVPVANQSEFLALVRQYSLMGSGVGFVDAHLLAAAKADGQIRLWTRDKRLVRIASILNLAYEP